MSRHHGPSKISCPRSAGGEVNSDVTKRHSRADKKSILFAQVRPADCALRPASHALSARLERASESADGGVRASGTTRGARAAEWAGGRMMYRVVELGSNCSGKWPRLEPARAAPRRERKPT